MIILSIQAILYDAASSHKATERARVLLTSGFHQNKAPEQVGGFLLVIPPRLLAFARG